MSDQCEEGHQEVLQALAEWNRTELLFLLHRLEQLEKQTDEPMFTRLAPLNIEEERKTATIEIMERVSDLEAKFGL